MPDGRAIEIEGWFPISTANSFPAGDWECANREQKPVLVCDIKTGKIMAGIVRDFLGDDGTLRKGIGAGGFGIFMPTHWRPLHGFASLPATEPV